MTERSRFWTTNNTGDGPSIGYSTSDWEKILRHQFNGGDEANGGILFGIGNALAVSGASSPLAVNTGAAMVYGHYYENDASLNLAVTTPVVGTTGGRVILRVNWAAQTVRALVNRNTDGLSAIPALTQSAGTTWEISLATFTITTGGVITLTDTRKYVKFSTRVFGDMLDPAIVDASTIEIASNVLRVKDAGITAAKLASNAVTTAKILDANVTTAKIADANVTTAKIADGNVTLAKHANDSVDDTKIGERVPGLHRRQGGNGSDWSIAGTTDLTPSHVRMQAGVNNAVFAAQTGRVVEVTFPVAFSNKPIVLLTIGDDTVTGWSIFVESVFATSFFYFIASPSSFTGTVRVNWLAIGPE